MASSFIFAAEKTTYTTFLYNELKDLGIDVVFCDPEKPEIIKAIIDHKSDYIIFMDEYLDSGDLKYYDSFSSTLNIHPIVLSKTFDLNLNKAIKRKNDERAITMYPINSTRFLMLSIEKFESYDNVQFSTIFRKYIDRIEYECSFIGLNRTHNAFKWIVDSIALITINEVYKNNYKDYLYKVLSCKYNGTASQIESGMRRSLSSFYKNCSDEIKRGYFRNMPSMPMDLTIKSFLNYMSERIGELYERTLSAVTKYDDSIKARTINKYYRFEIYNDTYNKSPMNIY